MSDTNEVEVKAFDVEAEVSVTRHYGAVSVGFSVKRVVTVARASDLLRENNKLLDIIDMQIEDFERSRLPNLPVPQSSGKTIDKDLKGAPKPQWYPAKELYFTVKDRKRYWYIRPTEGNWTKYGGAVYWDRMKGLTETEAKEMIDPDTFDHKFGDNIMVLIEIYQGKPRAIALAHKDQIGG